MPIGFPTKPGLVAYLTAGDPDLATTREIALAAIDNGADVIELGVPFSDPLADGPVIQRASERAVEKGTRLTDVLGLAKELRAARPSARPGILVWPKRSGRWSGGRPAHEGVAVCSPPP